MKLHLQTPSPRQSLLSGFNFSPISLPPPPHQASQEDGGLRLVHQTLSTTASSLGERLLTLFPCSSMRSLSQETVLHKLLQREYFPRAAALHKLPQHGSLPQGGVLQEQAAPVWVPHWVTSSVSKPALAWTPLSMGPQVLTGACSSVRSLPRATGGDLLHGGPPWTTGEKPASPWAAREDSLPQHLKHLLPLLLHWA